jgi:dCMP deaminase
MKEIYKRAFMDMAVRFGQTSHAERLKVGCLLVVRDQIVSQGVNGQPPGWPTEVCEDENNNTLPSVRHAEIAALDKLSRMDASCYHGYAFVSHMPCLACSRKLYGAGIDRVYFRFPYRDTSGVDWLKEQGIHVEKVD